MADLILKDGDSFVAGQLHTQLSNWSFLLNASAADHSSLVHQWIRDGVDVSAFFCHFKGNFMGRNFDSSVPPPTVIPNHASCKDYASEIASHLEERLRNGSLELMGKVGAVEPPRLVMPLVMVAGKKKNRLCHDERFLNLFMTKCPFSLETLRHIPQIIPVDAFVANCDEKSAYDGVSLSISSRQYFGVQFGGWLMQYTTLPFGWSISPYVYQTIGMQVTTFLRSKGIITMQYLDDRLFGPGLLTNGDNKRSTSDSLCLGIAILDSLGYTLALKKSTLEPTQCLTFLGLNVHTDTRNFSIPDEKRDSFKELRSHILRQRTIHLKLLQKLMGKCISFSLCSP